MHHDKTCGPNFSKQKKKTRGRNFSEHVDQHHITKTELWLLINKKMIT